MNISTSPFLIKYQELNMSISNNQDIILDLRDALKKYKFKIDTCIDSDYAIKYTKKFILKIKEIVGFLNNDVRNLFNIEIEEYNCGLFNTDEINDDYSRYHHYQSIAHRFENIIENIDISLYNWNYTTASLQFINLGNGIRIPLEQIKSLMCHDDRISNKIISAIINKRGIFQLKNDVDRSQAQAVLMEISFGLKCYKSYKVINPEKWIKLLKKNIISDIIKDEYRYNTMIDNIWIYLNEILFAQIENNNQNRIYFFEFVNLYIEDSIDPKFQQLIDKQLLSTLNLNRDQNPKFLKKIVTRLDAGLIDISIINRELEFFINLYLITKTPLLKILFTNIAYFIARNNITAIKNFLANNLLFVPLENNNIEESIKQELIDALLTIKNNINQELIRNILISELQHGDLNHEINQSIKQHIIYQGNSCNHELFHNINEENTNILLHAILVANNQKNNYAKLQLIKNAVINCFFNQEDLNLKLDSNEIFIAFLNVIDLKYIQQKCIKNRYFSLLNIGEHQYEEVYQIISKYMQWNNLINNLKDNKCKEIFIQITDYDQNLKSESLELYCSYVLSTLAYRSYENILTITQNTIIDDYYKQKFQLAITYCQLNNFTKNDITPLKIFIAEDKQTKENILITMKDICYLNSKNIDFDLEIFKINFLQNYQFQRLKHKLNINQFLANGDLINCSEFDDLFFNNLNQLIDNNSESINCDILNILNNFILSKSITKINLNKIINYNLIKTHLKEIDSQSLEFNHFKNIVFPLYLQKLINNKFTAHNLIAKHLDLMIANTIIQYKFNITEQQTKQLKEICYQIVSNPTKYIKISIEFKKQLINDFNDGCLLYLKTKLNPAGDFIQLYDCLKNKKLEQLATIFIKKAKQLKFTQGNNQIFDVLFNELNQLSSLKNQISPHEIAYILGIIFMGMSSTNVFGYHLGADNTAFTRFRLLGAYWLSEAVFMSEKNWTMEEKLAINLALSSFMWVTLKTQLAHYQINHCLKIC